MSKSYERVLLRSWLTFLCAFIWIVSSQSTLTAQTENLDLSDGISVLSWKRGNGKIVSKKFLLTLGANDDEFVADISGSGDGPIYRLTLTKTFTQTLSKPSIQCWFVTLKELTPFSTTDGFILGGNLLSEEAPGGLHKRVNLLCPIEVPHKVLDRGHYSIRQKRTFSIEAFQLVVSVQNYKFDENENRLLSTEISLKFTNQVR